MSFIESINAGLNKAVQSEQEIRAVTRLFASINEDLAAVSREGGTISLVRLTSAMTAAARAALKLGGGAGVSMEYLDADKLGLLVEVGEKNKRDLIDVASWRQSASGFPCILTYDSAEHYSFNLSELEVCLKELFETQGFGKRLREAQVKLENMLGS